MNVFQVQNKIYHALLLTEKMKTGPVLWNHTNSVPKEAVGGTDIVGYSR
jgi:hypothetical protein